MNKYAIKQTNNETYLYMSTHETKQTNQRQKCTIDKERTSRVMSSILK